MIPGLRRFGVEFGSGFEPFDGLIQFAFFEPLDAGVDGGEGGFAVLFDFDQTRGLLKFGAGGFGLALLPQRAPSEL